MTTTPSLGIPKPVDADWQRIQEQIDAIVHEHDPPVEEPPAEPVPVKDPPVRRDEGAA
jgi:hypothetical protein